MSRMTYDEYLYYQELESDYPDGIFCQECGVEIDGFTFSQIGELCIDCHAMHDDIPDGDFDNGFDDGFGDFDGVVPSSQDIPF